MPCSRIVKMQGVELPNITKKPSKLDYKQQLSFNPIGLKYIICNSGVKVYVQMLAIKERINPNHTHACLYDINGYPKIKECVIHGNKFAHFHITSSDPNALIKHYVVLFIEGTKSEKYDEIVDILFRTTRFLKIINEKPRFYIYYYGNRPAINTSLSEGKNIISRELRALMPSYSKLEPICETSLVDKKATLFVIHQNNRRITYLFNFS